MKKRKRLPIPQKEFGFTAGTFNLIQEWASDGDRIARECDQTGKDRECANKAQVSLLFQSAE